MVVFEHASSISHRVVWPIQAEHMKRLHRDTLNIAGVCRYCGSKSGHLFDYEFPERPTAAHEQSCTKRFWHHPRWLYLSHPLITMLGTNRDLKLSKRSAHLVI
jgi:hypothetical protein